MKKQRFWGVVVLGSLLIMLAGISPALGENKKLGGTERPVMEAMETPSFGAEDWVVESSIPSSFGTEDWVPAGTASFGAEDFVVASSIPPSFGAEDFILVSSMPPSFGAEDWVATMEYSDVVGTGALPEPAR